MQIQASMAASVAAAAASQTTSKDRASAPTSSSNSTPSTSLENVGKTEETSPDRDAQGGGEGLDPGSRKRSPSQAPAIERRAHADPELRAISTEPPSQLDIIG